MKEKKKIRNTEKDQKNKVGDNQNCCAKCCCNHKILWVVATILAILLLIAAGLFFFVCPVGRRIIFSQMPDATGSTVPTTEPTEEQCSTTTTTWPESTTTVPTLPHVRILTENIDRDFTKSRDKLVTVIQQILDILPECAVDFFIGQRQVEINNIAGSCTFEHEAIFGGHDDAGQSNGCSESEGIINIYVVTDCNALGMSSAECSDFKKALTITCQYVIDCAAEEKELIEKIKQLQDDLNIQ
uniref:Uncharacterized protein n=1 Tax=Panagrolaimus sp. JU765 TaxID=591449 RepID=A0AC34R0E2_9BILA